METWTGDGGAWGDQKVRRTPTKRAQGTRKTFRERNQRPRKGRGGGGMEGGDQGMEWREEKHDTHTTHTPHTTHTHTPHATHTHTRTPHASASYEGAWASAHRRIGYFREASEKLPRSFREIPPVKFREGRARGMGPATSCATHSSGEPFGAIRNSWPKRDHRARTEQKPSISAPFQRIWL